MHLRTLPSLFVLAPLLFACTPPTAGEDAGPDPELGPCDLYDDCGAGDGRPNRRSELQGVWDPVGQRLIIFGGSDAIPVNCGFPTPNFLDETWAFYPRCGIWKQLSGPAPSPRGRHMMAYDPAGHRAFVFGGRYRAGGAGNYTNYNDLWALDLETPGASLRRRTRPRRA